MYALAEWATPTNHVNQAMVWSRIVQQPRAARVKEVVRIEYPYALTDQGAGAACLSSSLVLRARLVPGTSVLQGLYSPMQGTSRASLYYVPSAAHATLSVMGSSSRPAS